MFYVKLHFRTSVLIPFPTIPSPPPPCHPPKPSASSPGTTACGFAAFLIFFSFAPFPYPLCSLFFLLQEPADFPLEATHVPPLRFQFSLLVSGKLLVYCGRRSNDQTSHPCRFRKDDGQFNPFSYSGLGLSYAFNLILRNPMLLFLFCTPSPTSFSLFDDIFSHKIVRSLLSKVFLTRLPRNLSSFRFGRNLTLPLGLFPFSFSSEP